MSRPAPRLGALLLGVVSLLPARAGAGQPSAPGSGSERVARALDAAVPAGLVVAQVVAPALPAGEVSVSWKAPSRGGWSPALVTLRSHGRERGRFWVRVELRPLRRVLIARRALAAGELLVAGALEVAERGLAPGEGIAVQGEEGAAQLAGARVVRALAAGQLVVEADVARPAVVAGGTHVKVVVRRGVVTVTAWAILDRAARPGEHTSARLTELGRLVTGRLISATTLLADEAGP